MNCNNNVQIDKVYFGNLFSAVPFVVFVGLPVVDHMDDEFTELHFITCARYCWNYCHFIISRSCFRPEVSLSIIVKCNVSHLGQSDRDRDRKWKITFNQ